MDLFIFQLLSGVYLHSLEAMCLDVTKKTWLPDGRFPKMLVVPQSIIGPNFHDIIQRVWGTRVLETPNSTQAPCTHRCPGNSRCGKRCNDRFSGPRVLLSKGESLQTRTEKYGIYPLVI
jgi:hypothetical protein